MLKIIENQKYPVVVLFLGFLLILVGFVDIQDLSKFKIITRSTPIYSLSILGFVLCVFSFLAHATDEVTISWLGSKKVGALPDGYCLKTASANVNLVFGRLEDVATKFPDSAIVLPANEFFDDECIDDDGSALGAYINSKFINQVDEVKKIISKELSNHSATEVEKETDYFQNSYGAGKCIYLNSILKSEQPVILAAVTTKRAGKGLSSELAFLYQATKEIFKITADQRLDSFCVPIMGSGHGGLKKEVALFGLLLALFECLKSKTNHHVKFVNIVIFKNETAGTPEISKFKAKKLLSISGGMLM